MIELKKLFERIIEIIYVKLIKNEEGSSSRPMRFITLSKKKKIQQCFIYKNFLFLKMISQAISNLEVSPILKLSNFVS